MKMFVTLFGFSEQRFFVKERLGKLWNGLFIFRETNFSRGR